MLLIQLVECCFPKSNDKGSNPLKHAFLIYNNYY